MVFAFDGTGFGRFAAVGGAFQSQLPALTAAAQIMSMVKARSAFVFIFVCANRVVAPVPPLRISCDLLGVICLASGTAVIAEVLPTRAGAENFDLRSGRACGTNRSLARTSIHRLRIFTENHFALISDPIF